MTAAATLVWLAPEPPDAQQARSLSAWSRAHGVRLTAPDDERPRALKVELPLGDLVEDQLERARDAVSAGDARGADAPLGSADALLRSHPELPQAAWLRAEVERTRAARERRIAPEDPAAADRAWGRAEALDGGRVAGVGEAPSHDHPDPATLTLDLAPAGAEAWVDGQRAPAPSVPTYAGPHAVVVRWHDEPVWAGWVEAPPGSSSVRIVALIVPACSADDVRRARPVADGATDAHGVECPAWVAASAGEAPGSVRIASCEASRCAPSIEWRAPPPWAWSPPRPERTERRRSAGWPAWATWALVGAGAAVAAGAAVVVAGLLQPSPAPGRFVSGGLKTQ